MCCANFSHLRNGRSHDQARTVNKITLCQDNHICLTHRASGVLALVFNYYLEIILKRTCYHISQFPAITTGLTRFSPNFYHNIFFFTWFKVSSSFPFTMVLTLLFHVSKDFLEKPIQLLNPASQFS